MAKKGTPEYEIWLKKFQEKKGLAATNPAGLTIQVKSAVVNGSKFYEYSIKGYRVASYTKGRDLFCKVGKGGSPENLRTVPKTTHTTQWYRDSLKELLGDKMPKFNDSLFKRTEECPDTKYGYPGYHLTSAKALEIVNYYMNGGEEPVL